MDSLKPKPNDLLDEVIIDVPNQAKRSIDHKFSRKERILTKKQFDLTFKQGKKSNHKGFLLLTRENQQGFPRLGVILSRKVGNAVYRNKLRRISREWFRTNKSKFRNIDLVLVFRPTQEKDIDLRLSNLLELAQSHLY